MEAEGEAAKEVAQTEVLLQSITMALPTTAVLIGQELMVGVIEDVEEAEVEEGEEEEVEVEEETPITIIATEHSAAANRIQQQDNRVRNLAERASLVLA